MPISEDTLKALRGMPSQAASADDGPSDQAQQLDAINEVKTGAKPPADEIIPKAPPRTNNWPFCTTTPGCNAITALTVRTGMFLKSS